MAGQPHRGEHYPRGGFGIRKGRKPKNTGVGMGVFVSNDQPDFDCLILMQCFECIHVQELPEAGPCEECGGSTDLLRLTLRGKVAHHYGEGSTYTAM